MQEEKNKLIKDLSEKISTLIHFYEDAKNELIDLRTTNEKLKKSLEEKERLLNELETKTNNIKFAKTIIASSSDKDDAKRKIKLIVREIDKCIALLNR